ncbi:MAG: hypothetical protein ACK5SI_10180, partial [Planctomycetia bacterium]
MEELPHGDGWITIGRAGHRHGVDREPGDHLRLWLSGNPRQSLIHIRCQVGEEVIGEERRHDSAKHRSVDEPGRRVAPVRAALDAARGFDATEALILPDRAAEDHRMASLSADWPNEHLRVEVHAVDCFPLILRLATTGLAPPAELLLHGLCQLIRQDPQVRDVPPDRCRLRGGWMLSPRRKASSMRRFTLDRTWVMNTSFIEPKTGRTSEDGGLALSTPSLAPTTRTQVSA